jgi:hypothetical protein
VAQLQFVKPSWIGDFDGEEIVRFLFELRNNYPECVFIVGEARNEKKLGLYCKPEREYVKNFVKHKLAEGRSDTVKKLQERIICSRK